MYWSRLGSIFDDRCPDEETYRKFKILTLTGHRYYSLKAT